MKSSPQPLNQFHFKLGSNIPWLVLYQSYVSYCCHFGCLIAMATKRCHSFVSVFIALSGHSF